MPSRAPVADPELFSLDSQGSTSIRNALLTDYNQGGVSRRRKGATKPLKAAQIIAERDAASHPALEVSKARQAKRKRELESGVTPAVKRKLNALANRQANGQGLWSVSSRQRPNELSEAVRASGSYDAWEITDLPSTAIPEDIREVVAAPKPKAPRSLRKHHILKDNRPVAVSVPHPGTSYNPTQVEHQQLLRTALDKAEVEEEKQQADEAAKARIEAVRALDKGKELWEHAEMDVDREERTKEGEDEDQAAIIEKRMPKRKTEKAKRKAAQNRRSEAVARQQRLQARAERQAIASLPGAAKAARRTLAERRAAALARQEARVSTLRTQGLTGKRVGKDKVPAASLDYQISDELAEGLRALKPEGNLWRDWAGSATRRGMTEAPRLKSHLQKKAKGRKLKVTEKHTWRTWRG